MGVKRLLEGVGGLCSGIMKNKKRICGKKGFWGFCGVSLKVV